MPSTPTPSAASVGSADLLVTVTLIGTFRMTNEYLLDCDMVTNDARRWAFGLAEQVFAQGFDALVAAPMDHPLVQVINAEFANAWAACWGHFHEREERRLGRLGVDSHVHASEQ